MSSDIMYFIYILANIFRRKIKFVSKTMKKNLKNPVWESSFMDAAEETYLQLFHLLSLRASNLLAQSTYSLLQVESQKHLSKHTC